MPWVDFVEKTHDCRLEGSLPDPKYAATELNAWIGSIYKCDLESCGRVYKLVNTQLDGWWWEDVTPMPPPPI